MESLQWDHNEVAADSPSAMRPETRGKNDTGPRTSRTAWNTEEGLLACVLNGSNEREKVVFPPQKNGFLDSEENYSIRCVVL